MNLPVSPNAASAAPQRSPRLLVVDDEPGLRTVLQEYFARQGFEVLAAEHAGAARALLAQTVPDVAILDINMPGENGLSLARWLRAGWPTMGLLMLTTAGEAVDRVVGLELGADDYVPKPCDLRELLARVRAVQRRLQAGGAPMDGAPAAATAMASAAAPAAPAATSTRRVAFGHCTLDLDQRKLFGQDGAEIDITAAEYDLLALFARHPNRPLNRDQIMEQAHNRGWDVFDRSIDLRVMRLRRKIERNPERPELIKTVRNVGYVFVSRA
jgi:two-component system phosphate regulon response regulator OmpR